jgi:PhnB protein
VDGSFVLRLHTPSFKEFPMSTTAAATLPQPDSPPVLGVAAYLTVDGAIRASEFYQRALGAKEVARIPVDAKGRTMHVHLHVNNGSVMLSDAYPEHGHSWKEPGGFCLHLQVKGVDAWWKRAIDAGAQVVLPLQVMFWGDRYGQFRDPFGVLWSVGEPVTGN